MGSEATRLLGVGDPAAPVRRASRVPGRVGAMRPAVSAAGPAGAERPSPSNDARRRLAPPVQGALGPRAAGADARGPAASGRGASPGRRAAARAKLLP